MSNNRQFDIIIVNYNSTPCLIDCLHSVYSSFIDGTVNIFIQDNSLRDETPDIRNHFRDIHITFNPKNIGFAAGINQGIGLSRSEYIFILNPDTIISSTFFMPMIEYMDKHPDVGIVGPKILDSDGKTQGSARAFPNALTALYGRSSPLTRYFPNNPISRANIVTIESDGKTPQEVDWVSGAGMIVRRKAIQEVGLMDEKFFMYWEDADWCRRMWLKGWKVVYFPLVFLHHHIGKSSGTRPLRSIYNFHFSSYLLYKKYSKDSTKYLLSIAFFALSVRGSLVACWNILQRYFFRQTLPATKVRHTCVTPPTATEKSFSIKKIKVLRVISRINIGGPAIHVNLLQNGLNKAEFESTLVAGRISPSEGDMNYIIQADSDHFISIPEMQRELNPWKDIISLYKLFQLIRRKKPHIVHSHTAKAGTLARGAVVLCNLFCRQDIKTIHTFHGHVFEGYFSKFKSRSFLWTERLMAAVTDKIIAISPTQCEDLTIKHRISNTDKVETIKLGFDLEPFVHSAKLKGNFRKELTINNEVKLVGIVGRLVPVKNHFIFLNSVKYFMSQHPDMKILFAIIGDGEMRDELQEFCIRLGISEHVRFYGWMKDIAQVYADLDLLALTSINEGTPVSIIEAMAAGVPVISTDAGGIKDLLGNPIGPQSSNGFRVCERGILLPQSDPKSLAEGMRYIFDNSEIGNQQMVSNARQFVLSEYHQDRLIQDIRSLYKNLL